jgi:formylglycine-generating enzyme required for sulfatase activity
VVLAVLELLTGVGAARAQPAKPKDGPLGMKFVPLPKGTFYMHWGHLIGDPAAAVKKTEIKQDFEIAVYTVTQGQWQKLMGSNPSGFSRKGENKEKVKDIKDEDLEQFPVERVSWFDAQEFIKKLNEQEKGKGYLYRLPTDAEWEYACRGGATSEKDCSYHFYFREPTNDLSSEQANFNGEFPFGKGKKGPFLGRTTKVGSYVPNQLGLYDMHGNVGQWTATVLRNQDPLRVYRGGSYIATGSVCRAAFQAAERGVSRNSYIGFRLVRVPVQ